MNGSGSNVELQERDLKLLRGLLESRVMTLAHAAALYFDGKTEATKKRVQRLKAAGFLSERPRRPYEPSVLYLSRRGFEAFCERDPDPPPTSYSEKRARVSELTLRHELEVMSVTAAIITAVRGHAALRVATFTTCPQLIEFKAEQPAGGTVTVKPDGFIQLLERSGADVFEHTFFVEVDRSTESQETVAMKAGCYRDYYRGGGFALRNGHPRSDYESFPFRVLMVFRNTERRNNAAERLLLLKPPILSQVWLTTLAEVVTEPLGAIWTRPVDFRNVVRGTAFDLERGRTGGTYRRQVAREALVEMQLAKHPLIAADQAGDAEPLGSATSSPSQAS